MAHILTIQGIEIEEPNMENSIASTHVPDENDDSVIRPRSAPVNVRPVVLDPIPESSYLDDDVLLLVVYSVSMTILITTALILNIMYVYDKFDSITILIAVLMTTLWITYIFETYHSKYGGLSTKISYPVIYTVIEIMIGLIMLYLSWVYSRYIDNAYYITSLGLMFIASALHVTVLTCRLIVAQHERFRW